MKKAIVCFLRHDSSTHISLRGAVWVLTVEENLNEIGFKIQIDKLRSIKQDKYKKDTKSHIYKSAFKYLLAKAADHSKMDNLLYEKYEMQSYLKNGKLSKNEAQNYFRF